MTNMQQEALPGIPELKARGRYAHTTMKGRDVRIADCKTIIDRIMESEISRPFDDELHYIQKKTLTVPSLDSDAGILNTPQVVFEAIHKAIFDEGKVSQRGKAIELWREIEARILTVTDGIALKRQYFRKRPNHRLDSSDYCAECAGTGELLICDGDCHQSFHLKCVGLSTEPLEARWYCPLCSKRRRAKEAQHNGGPGKKNAVKQAQLPNFSPSPPVNFVSNLQNSVSWITTERQILSVNRKVPLSSHILPSANKDIAPRDQHLTAAPLEPNLKKSRRTAEEKLRKAHYMRYDPIWCMWRPVDSKNFARMLREGPPILLPLKCHSCGGIEDAKQAPLSAQGLPSNFESNEMLFCHSCDAEYHIRCLPEDLRPESSDLRWFCPDCQSPAEMESVPQKSKGKRGRRKSGKNRVKRSRFE